MVLEKNQERRGVGVKMGRVVGLTKLKTSLQGVLHLVIYSPLFD